VPWTLEYHPTRFAFHLSKPGPVVIVLSQLDDRYFRGLEGQYRFDLSFRLHKNDEDDYVVRSGTTYRMNRSVNVELDLDAGEYTVLVKIDAKRDDRIKSVESVVKANARSRREKLIRIGLAYDLAHSKGKIVESAEDKAARKAAEERMKERARKKFRERRAKQRERDHYLSRKQHEREKRKNEKKEAKKKAKAEKKKAEAAAKQKEEEEEEEAKKVIPEKSIETSAATKAESSDKMPALTKSESSSKKVTIALPESSDKQKEESKDTDSNNSTSEGQNTPSVDSHEAQPGPAAEPEQPSAGDVMIARDAAPEDLKPEESFQTARESNEGEAQVLAASRTIDSTLSARENATNATDVGTQTEIAPNVNLGPGVVASDEIESDVPPDGVPPGQKPPKQKSKHHRNSRPHGLPPPPPPNMMFRGPAGMGMGMGMGMYGMPPPPPQMPFGTNPFAPQHMRRPPPPGMRPRQGRGSPAGSGYNMGSGSDEDSDDTIGSLSSMSAMSDREVDIMLETQRRHGPGYHSPPPPPLPYGSKDPDDAKDPWNAVAVVGLRVYYKLPEDVDPLDEVVTLKVERPNRYAVDEDERGEKKQGADSSSVKSGEAEEALDASKVLDVDDSAKDATLGDEEGERERRKSLAASAESSFRVENKGHDTDGEDTAKE
jgi:chemotaxis protein histidine kinase CheA